jgi:hypothetical protein
MSASGVVRHDDVCKPGALDVFLRGDESPERVDEFGRVRLRLPKQNLDFVLGDRALVRAKHAAVDERLDLRAR